MPNNTIYVGRPTKWGNPYVIKSFVNGSGHKRFVYTSPLLQIPNTGGWGDEKDALDQMVNFAYKRHIESKMILGELDIAELRGKNLACWCKEGETCHADVLLRLANL